MLTLAFILRCVRLGAKKVSILKPSIWLLYIPHSSGVLKLCTDIHLLFPRDESWKLQSFWLDAESPADLRIYYYIQEPVSLSFSLWIWPLRFEIKHVMSKERTTIKLQIYFLCHRHIECLSAVRSWIRSLTAEGQQTLKNIEIIHHFYSRWTT